MNGESSGSDKLPPTPEELWIDLVRRMVDAGEFNAPGPMSDAPLEMPFERWVAVDMFVRRVCRELDRERKRTLIAPSAASARPPTDKEVQDTLFLFRSQLDKNMENSSGSPGHDAMRVALGKLFKGLALPSSADVPASAMRRSDRG
jgi:hypothetical protein